MAHIGSEETETDLLFFAYSPASTCPYLLTVSEPDTDRLFTMQIKSYQLGPCRNPLRQPWPAQISWANGARDLPAVMPYEPLVGFQGQPCSGSDDLILQP